MRRNKVKTPVKLTPMMGHAGLVLAALGALPAWATPYTFTQLPIFAGGLNNAGQVVGLSSIPNTFGYGSNLALYDHGAVTLLGFGPVGAFNNFLSVSGINDSGLIIGSTSTTHFSMPFAYQNGLSLNLGPVVGSTDTSLNAVNDKGEIVGTPGFGFNGPPSGFLLSNGVVTTITASGPPRYPGDLNPLSTNLTGINNLDQIVGVALSGTYNGNTGFLLSGGVYSPITVPGSTQTSPTAINDNGEVVGTFTDAGNAQHGFEEENNVFSTIFGPGGGDFLPSGLNNSGQIIGVLAAPSMGNPISYLGTPQGVPEPSTLALLCTGLMGLLGWRTRARQGGSRG